jgi:hypothetical protein
LELTEVLCKRRPDYLFEQRIRMRAVATSVATCRADNEAELLLRYSEWASRISLHSLSAIAVLYEQLPQPIMVLPIAIFLIRSISLRSRLARYLVTRQPTKIGNAGHCRDSAKRSRLSEIVEA